MIFKKNICPLCKQKETKFFKFFFKRDRWVKLPNEFWICENCFKIEVNKIIINLGCEPFFWVKDISLNY